jgi:4-hydroxymandelate oxidase
MSRHDFCPASRRRVLQFLATGPLMTAGPLTAFAQGLPARPPDPMVWAPRDLDNVITDPKQALDVFDFEPVAKKNLPPGHFGVMVTGADDEVTLRANCESFQKFQLRPRRLVDVSKIDMATEIFGARYDSPIVIAPTGGNHAFHPDGEIAVAKAAKAGNHLQMLATGASTSIEDAIAARGAPVWFQLYPTNQWDVAEALVRRAERAGSPVIALTVDTLSPNNWETLARLRRSDTRNCADCHGGSLAQYVARRPNFDGIDLTGTTSVGAPNMNWDFIKRLRDTVKGKLLLKGILAHEDAVLAGQAGIDAIPKPARRCLRYWSTNPLSTRVSSAKSGFVSTSRMKSSRASSV